MAARVRGLQAAVALVSTALTAALLLVGLAAYQHGQAELASLMQVVGRDVLLLERDWSRRGVIVTPDFEVDLAEFARSLDGFERLALLAGGGKSPNRFSYYSKLVTPEYFSVRRYPLAEGRAFSMGERAAVVGHDHANLLGRRIEVFGYEVEVVGVLAPLSERGGPDLYADGTVFVPYDLMGLTVPMEAYLEFASEDALQAARPLLERWLAERKYPYMVQPLANLYGLELRWRLREVLGGALLWGLLAVLLAAATNLSAYSLARALERIRELGIRRAVGASAADLRREMLAASLFWAAAGLLLGFGLASGLSRWFAGETGLDASPTFLSVAGVGLGLVLLTLASAHPAARWAAARPPAEALRGAAASLPRRRLGLAFAGLALALAAFGAQLGISHSAQVHARRMVGEISNRTAIYTSFLFLGRHSLTDPRGTIPLKHADYTALLNSPLAERLERTAYVENYRLHEFAEPGSNLRVFVRAFEGPYLELAGPRLLLGRWPEPGSGEVALGRRLAEYLFQDLERALGQRVKALGRQWTVVGVYASAEQDAPGAPSDDQILLPRQELRRTLPGARAEILVERKPGASERVFDEVARFLTERHPEPGFRPVEPLVRDDLEPPVRAVMDRLAAAYRMLALVMLALAVAGITAQAMVDTEKRFRELGIRRALGATRGRLFYELLAPMAAGALLSGVAGALAGAGAAYAVVRAHEVTWAFSWVAVVAVVLAAPLLAALAAALPAWRAVRRPPAEAMRME